MPDSGLKISKNMSCLILLFSGFSTFYYAFAASNYAAIYLETPVYAISFALLAFFTGLLAGKTFCLVYPGIWYDHYKEPSRA